MIYEELIKGKNISLRYVECSDSEFILRLRTDDTLNKYINYTENDIDKQKNWIMNQQKKPDDYYFIIYNKTNEKIGVISLYNIEKGNAELGRWISVGNAIENLESVVLLHDFGFEILKLKTIYTCTAKDNKKVVNFWKRFGGNFGGEIETNDFILHKNVVSFGDYYNKIKKKVEMLLI